MMSLSSQPPSSPSSGPLPLEQLVALLPDDGEHDARWGARRQGERIPFSKPIAITRVDPSGPSFSATAEASSEIMFSRPGFAGSEGAMQAVFDGWALNVCHGGMRIITEEPLKLGDELQIDVSSSGTAYTGKARVCWVRKEADGVVAGLEFSQVRGS